MNKLLLSSSLTALAVFGLASACGSDDGGSVHGTDYGPVPAGDAAPGDDGSTDDAPSSTDAGGDAQGDAQEEGGPDPSCTTGTAVVLAGSDTALTGAAQSAASPWAGGAIAGGAALSHPAIIPFGSTGFLALTRGPSNALQSLTFGSTWGAATAVSGASAVDAPALALVAGDAQAVYLAPAPAGGGAQYFYRIENDGSSWSAAAPVMAGGSQSFGQSGASIAGAGAELALAQDGGDNDGLYTQLYDSGSWSSGAPVDGAGTLTTAPPSLVAVTGTYDLVLLYADNTTNHVIGAATRVAATKTWNTATMTQATAQTSEQPQVALASATSLVVTFRGNNQRPYVMTGTIGTSGITWSVPAPLLADASTVDSAPAVAKGVCGDDAIAVFASAGQVKATRLRGTTWTIPEAIAGLAGSRVAVATR